MSKDRNNKKGFTLAEVLITLTIIGVVAALTIPSLLSNVSDKTYEAKRKGLQTRLAQAVSQMDNLNSYGDKTDPVKNSSMNFVVDGLSKVFKITNVCEFDNFTACDFPEYMSVWWYSNQLYTKDFKQLRQDYVNYTLTANDLGGPPTDAVTFKTKNGESFLFYYNPYCISEQDAPPGGQKMFTKEICAAFKVDLDGAKKGPNIEGRDIVFGLILYPDVPYVVIMNPHFVGECNGKASYNASGYNLEQCCSSTAAEGSTKGSLTSATREQAYILSIFHTKYQNAWTSSVDGSGPDDYGWMVNLPNARYMPRKTAGGLQYCVRRESTKS